MWGDSQTLPESAGLLVPGRVVRNGQLENGGCTKGTTQLTQHARAKCDVNRVEGGGMVVGMNVGW
jgi:hypothetical protein